MSDNRPAPLTPPEADLQDFPFMPLQVARLRDSDLAAEESPEACWYAVLLWSAAWHQIPAGSLPDNDAVLAKLIGLGRDVKTFRKHKAGAMRGFVLCSDGRLYHDVVAEQVHAAWSGKLQQRWRTECARIKKHNQRTGADDPLPTFEEWSQGQTVNVPRDTPKCPEGQGVQETGTGTERLSSEDKSSDAGGVVIDPNKDAWRLALVALKDQGGLSDAEGRKFFGRLLKDHGLQARDLYGVSAECVGSGTPDPRAYLTKAAQNVARRRTPINAEAKRVGFV